MNRVLHARTWMAVSGTCRLQFRLNVGWRNIIRAMIELSFARIRRIIAETCSSNSRSLNLLRSRYTGRLLRLFRIKAILYECDIGFRTEDARGSPRMPGHTIPFSER